jgi:hypothetical protein
VRLPAGGPRRRGAGAAAGGRARAGPRPPRPAPGTAVPARRARRAAPSSPVICPGIRCRRGRGPACHGRFDVPGVDLCCTFRVPVMCLGLLSAGPGPCPAAARRWSANRFHLHAARGWGRLCLTRGRRFRSLPGGTALAALVRGGRAGCGRRVLARERCPRSSRGPGGGSTGTGKTRQPTGGSPATGRPARGRRPARRSAAGPAAVGAEGLRPGARDRGPGRSAELADRLAGFANLSPCRTAS